MPTSPYLQKGDKITVVATARKVSYEELQFAKSFFTSWGLDVNYGKTIGTEKDQYSGTDEQRLADFQDALDDTTCKAIMVARGGYGTTRIVDQIDFRKFSKHPKWICGFSDVTVLHSHLQALYGIPTIHSAMPINFRSDDDLELPAADTLRKALFGEKLLYRTDHHVLNKFGKTEAELVGGNLSMLYSLSGTQSDMQTDGKILLLEDLDEYLYHLDRMIQQLKRSGKLENLEALIIGGMTEMKDNKIPFGKSPEEIILDAVSEYAYPVCFNFPLGHQDDNRAVRLGMKAKLTVDASSGSFVQ